MPIFNYMNISPLHSSVGTLVKEARRLHFVILHAFLRAMTLPIAMVTRQRKCHAQITLKVAESIRTDCYYDRILLPAAQTFNGDYKYTSVRHVDRYSPTAENKVAGFIPEQPLWDFCRQVELEQVLLLTYLPSRVIIIPPVLCSIYSTSEAETIGQYRLHFKCRLLLHSEKNNKQECKLYAPKLGTQRLRRHSSH